MLIHEPLNLVVGHTLAHCWHSATHLTPVHNTQARRHTKGKKMQLLGVCGGKLSLSQSCGGFVCVTDNTDTKERKHSLLQAWNTNAGTMYNKAGPLQKNFTHASAHTTRSCFFWTLRWREEALCNAAWLESWIESDWKWVCDTELLQVMMNGKPLWSFGSVLCSSCCGLVICQYLKLILDHCRHRLIRSCSCLFILLIVWLLICSVLPRMMQHDFGAEALVFGDGSLWQSVHPSEVMQKLIWCSTTLNTA